MDVFWSRIPLLGMLILLSGFFSGTEIAIFSLGRAQRQALAQSPRRLDKLLGTLLRQPNRLIASILVGNELVNITIGAVTTAIGQRVFSGYDQLVVTLGTTAMLLPILVLFGEVLPKSIAIKAPHLWAALAARPVAVFAVLVGPIRAIVRGVASVVTWPLGVRGGERQEPGIREAEFRSMVDVGQEEGTVRGEERRLIHNVFEFADKSVGAIMTPAAGIFALSCDLPIGRIADAVARSHFSRIPIFRGRRNNIVGILLAKDLVGHARGMLPKRTLTDLVHPAFYIPKASRCDDLFRQMQRRRMHMAIAVDEYGRTVGIVTMEDLLSELFGEIPDEKGSTP